MSRSCSNCSGPVPDPRTEAFGYLSSPTSVSRDRIPLPFHVQRFSVVNTEAATGPLDPSARGSAPMINRSRESSRADRANTFHLPVHAYVPARMAYAKFDFVQIDKRERGKEWLDR